MMAMTKKERAEMDRLRDTKEKLALALFDVETQLMAARQLGWLNSTWQPTLDKITAVLSAAKKPRP